MQYSFNGNVYTLGLDLSTQSISATILEKSMGEQNGANIRCWGNWSVGFRELANKYQLNSVTLCLPQVSQNLDGFYAQPPQMFLECLDLLFAKMQAEGAPLSNLTAVNCAVQQHGQVWLNENFVHSCQQLNDENTSSLSSPLTKLFANSYAYPAVPIWMCNGTDEEARHLLHSLGTERVLELSGSAAPLRFSGLVLRALARHDAAAYQRCHRVHLLSSWLAALLSGNNAAPIDWGSGAGTALMDYRGKVWAPELLCCLAAGLPGGAQGLQTKLPRLAFPLEQAGTIATYFGQYGFSTSCIVLAGSGDNPQTKVCQRGDLLSLGSSFVMMSGTTCRDGSATLHKWANAMYDGLGQPFSFACRSNGALVWDALREHLGLSLSEQDKALVEYPLGLVKPARFCLLNESFPPGPATHRSVQDFRGKYRDKRRNLVAVIDGTLCEFHRACGEVFLPSAEPLYITGGLSQSVPMRKRIEQIWQRPVKTVAKSGAAYGAALGGLVALTGA